MTHVQCEKCPWRTDVDPYDIPNGYCETKHKGMRDTIQEGLVGVGGLRIMACHDSPVGAEEPCVGYLYNQLGEGNNIGLRMWAMKNLKGKLITHGEQHRTFEETLP